MKQVKEDLLAMFDDGQFDVIAHGCNCFCRMGAGIADQIADRYPAAYAADLQTRYERPINKLGHYTKALIGDRQIYNLYTQYVPGKDFRLAALSVACDKMIVDLVDQFQDKISNIKIGFPWIGCGIGGGNIAEVRTVLHNKFQQLDLTLVEYSR